MKKNEIELADFKEQANTYYKNLTKNAPHKGIGSHEYIYFSYGIEWAFNHLPQSNYNKLKEDNALLLDALKGLYEFNLGKPDYLDTLLNNAESAILKAESK